jgi:hypothetical protein
VPFVFLAVETLMEILRRNFAQDEIPLKKHIRCDRAMFMIEQNPI